LSRSLSFIIIRCDKCTGHWISLDSLFILNIIYKRYLQELLWCCGFSLYHHLLPSIAPSCRRRAIKGRTKGFTWRNKRQEPHWILRAVVRCCAECVGRTTINKNFPLVDSSQIARLPLQRIRISQIQRCDIFHQFGSHYYQSH